MYTKLRPQNFWLKYSYAAREAYICKLQISTSYVIVSYNRLKTTENAPSIQI